MPHEQLRALGHQEEHLVGDQPRVHGALHDGPHPAEGQDGLGVGGALHGRLDLGFAHCFDFRLVWLGFWN